MAVARALGRMFAGTHDSAPIDAPPPATIPTTRWDNVGLAVDRAMAVFMEATAGLPTVRRVDAKSSGPTVHFLVTAGAPWHEVIDRIEGRLFPLAKAGDLPPIDYEVQEGTGEEETEPGYITVFRG